MNIRKNLLCVGAALAAALTLMPAALAAEPGESAQAAPEVRAVLAEAPFPEESPPLAEDWRLLLVNPWNTLPEDYNVELATLSNGLQVDARIYDALEEMLSGCRAAGLSPVVCSAYRTEAKQRQL